MRRLWPVWWIGLAMLVASSSACDTPTVEPECPGDPSCPGEGDNGIVDGVNLNVLFAEPSVAEIQRARREISGRPPSVVSVETVTTLDLGGRETVRVVAGLDADGDTAFVGAIRVPPRIPGDQRARPLMLVLSEGPDVNVEQAVDVPPLRSGLEGEFVTVVMGYRGQRLSVAGRTFSSELTPEPYDRDADDVVALVDHARANAGLDRSDNSRLAAVGWGRGGGVVLLASARGLNANMVLSFGGTSNFFLDLVKADARRYLTNVPISNLPQLETVLAASAGAVRAGTKTLSEARLELLMRSPAFLYTSPPYLFAAHGGRDSVVPVEHGRSIAAVLNLDGVYLEIEESAHGPILTEGQVISTVSDLLCQRILPSEPVCGG
ncbi:MAG: hypothetical protein Rubg2KO_11140 [Rubricoccaceae bacterium]